jgi:uncharacterized repeat protein (TIGR01451 family)
MSFLHLLSASRQKQLAVAKRSFFHLKLNSTLLFALLSSSLGWLILPSLAAPVPAGTTIENQATGTYVDTLNNDSVGAESNIVKITVGEVAGITVTPGSISGTVSAGNTVYYSYTITNVGNDATQFYIPENARVTGNGVQNGDIQIIGYDLNGATPVVLAAANYVNIGAGVATGDANVLATNGIIQPGGSVTIRVPVKVNTTAAVNDFITVLFGDTPEIASSTTTPKERLQNQAYIDETADQKYDVYTVDNINGATGEFDNPPLNGDLVNRRQEASAAQRATVIGVDYGDAPDTGTGVGPENYQTTLDDGGPSHVIKPGLLIGTKIDADSSILQNTTADADNASGTPNDEDGVVSLPVLKTAAGETYTVPVKVTNTTGQPAYLVGYIDFNQNGDFSDTEDKSVTITVPSGATVGTYNVTFTTPTGMTPGNTYLRLRLGAVQAEVESSVGAAASGEVEDYALEIISPATITGTVFEDPKYGGGAGRAFISTVATPPRKDARVELYDSAGAFKGFAITDIDGLYKFDTANVTGGIVAGNYKVRVVNSTVTSSRVGYLSSLIPVQTFRTDAGTVVGQVDNVTDRVGGEEPAKIDALANTSANLSTLDTATAEVQSITSVKVAGTDITGIDFGFNFDTIVNTKDAGQGSLRQFILNSNALSNTNTFQQDGQLAGREVSIFMIPVNQVAASTNNSGAAVITLLSPLDAVTGNSTTISGFTQTTNIGDTNSGQVGTAPTVGVDGLGVLKVDRPEIVIDGRNLTDSTNADQYAITLNGDKAILRGVAVYGTKGTYATSAGGDSGAVRIGKSTGSNVANAAIIEQNLIGTYADGTDPGALLQNQRYGTICFAACEITNNYIAYNGYGTVLYGAEANNSKITGNEYQFNGPNSAPSSGQKSAEGDSIGVWSASRTLIQKNLIANTRSVGSNTLDSGKGIELVSTLAAPTSGNEIKNNTINAASTAGIGAYNNASGNTIYRNIIKNTSPVAGSPAYAGAGILLSASSSTLPFTTLAVPVGNTISENSIYGNSGLGIDTDPNSWALGNGVSPNNGAKDPVVPNVGIDYPVISSANIVSGNLVVKGFVGNVVPGSTIFGSVKLEFFIADNSPANQNGPVLEGDGKNKPHGEGKTFLGTCNANVNGLFDCTLPLNGLTNATMITATATDGDGNTSEFSSVALNNPDVFLVKRITSINGSMATLNGQNLATYNDDSVDTNDNEAQWPSSFLVGGFNGGNVKPGDAVEYTIYFLSKGEGTANNVSICDLVPEKQTFVPSIAMWTNPPVATPATVGALGNSGIVAQYNNQTLLYSNLTGDDKARYIPAGEPLPVSCRQKDPLLPNNTIMPPNTNGAIVIDLGTVVNQINETPIDKPYGFLRFRTKVN